MEAHGDGGHAMIIEDMKYLIKGKRSKRRRPSSTLTLTLASTTTTETAPSANLITSAFFQTPSIEFTNILQDMNHTNNDQDVAANCLMLLAHGRRLPPPQPPSNTANQSYVYECKTCDRGFTSFQALGGHRASHNKPHKELPKDTTSCNPSGSTKWPKAHECSICGSSFTSGQALGGHMRRHRSMTMITTTTSTTTKTETSRNTSNQSCHTSKKHKTLLPALLELDLNLPAPIEDIHDHRETNISFGSNNNQIIVFSAPSLIDCHF